jgi:hypothetical protein
MNEWSPLRPPRATKNWTVQQTRCAGVGQPYQPGTYRPAARTGRCPICLQWSRLTQDGLLVSHAPAVR